MSAAELEGQVRRIQAHLQQIKETADQAPTPEIRANLLNTLVEIHLSFLSNLAKNLNEDPAEGHFLAPPDYGLATAGGSA